MSNVTRFSTGSAAVLSGSSATGAVAASTGAAVNDCTEMSRTRSSPPVRAARRRAFGGADTYAARNWVRVLASDFRMP
ncbi:hypothetical protein GCM10022202_20190 [Microbacterium marinilacus]|uniref:Secreted protein n=1 Tax=Microbacterium marinilacus TaxID=415209 RepID=A0ABP7BGS4_9MICO